MLSHKRKLNPGKIQKLSSNDPMKITKVESVRFSDKIKIGGGAGDDQGAEFCWVRLHTDSGIIGTGETYPNNNGELGALKDMATRFLLGKDTRDIDGIWQSIYQYSSMRNAGGSDMRILSAINMAQLDILGKSTGTPLYRLLGGKTRPRVKVYNTYIDGWLINDMKMGPRYRKDCEVSARPWDYRYEDLSFQRVQFYGTWP